LTHHWLVQDESPPRASNIGLKGKLREEAGFGLLPVRRQPSGRGFLAVNRPTERQ
jgi:hypothetical protein